ncbi:MAG: aldehyde dehydrogenase family protein [Candidatus Gracilibacteria bacterium]|nr:aldehyde dehydrogenase family protein [Candidatus Gracilibacteria bacterium]
MSKIKSINPYTEEINAEFETLTESEVQEKIQIAHNTYLSWRETSSSYKKELFFKLAGELEKDVDECARLETIEMGMLNHIAKAGLLKTADLIRWFANNFEEVLAETNYEAQGFKVKQVYDSIGVIFGIAPWNFPFNQLLRAAVPNILAGNTQVYKHSSNVPLVALKIEELFKKAGFPNGVYTNLFVSSSMSEFIISNKYIAGVNLTGSEGAGSAIGALAGKYLKRSVLELGGNDAFIVTETKNLDGVIEQAVNGRIRNGGQACNSSKRFLITEKYYDEFLEKYTSKMSKLVVGDPMDSNTQIQPLSSKKAILDIESQVLKAVNSGARITTGGKKLDRKGYFFAPTVLADVTPETSSFNEEIFGPVASIIKVKDIKDAIKLANATDFGLSACVFGDDIEELTNIAKELEGGMIFINSTAASKASLPFGGVKKSGYGKENGPDGILAFTNKKVIII